MSLRFEHFYAFLGAATKLLVCLTVTCLGIAFGLALLGFSESVAKVQEWTLTAAFATAAAFAILIIAWVSGDLARRIEGRTNVGLNK
jgi:hypothetical protein